MKENRIGLYPRITTVLPENVDLVKYAEERGFTAVWQNEYRTARDAVVPAAAYAAVTDDIRVGLGVINNWTRNVALTAQTCATLAELAGPDRVVAGVGTWWDPIASRVGINRRRPLRALREYVETLRSLLDGQRVTYDGEFVHLDDVAVEFVDDAPQETVPVYVGATGPQMLRLAGEFSDGVVMNFLTTPEYTECAVEHIHEGATRSNRTLADIDRVQTIITSMDEDQDAALDRSRRFVTQYVGQHPEIMAARDVMEEELVQSLAETVGEWPASEESIEAGMELVPDDVVRSLTATGTPEQCRERVREYADAGCQEPILSPLDMNARSVIDAFADGY
jgi:alkanesulfonate monooxygenase SsuD/methylene tetrahydromethanopterin reductase-like flavin-dependent oxidoreductase (luciferase family)